MIGLKKSGMTLWMIVLMMFCAAEAFSEDFSRVPEKGKVTMIDLGAKKCIPCKMMAPIMDKLKKAYEGKAEIIFIDVWENRQEAPRFGVRAIPTQIFFDEQGKEVFRHMGFLDEKSIVDRLTQMGIEKPEF